MNVHYFNCDYRLYSLLSKLSNVNLITAADKVWSSGTNGWLLCTVCDYYSKILQAWTKLASFSLFLYRH